MVAKLGPHVSVKPVDLGPDPADRKFLIQKLYRDSLVQNGFAVLPEYENPRKKDRYCAKAQLLLDRKILVSRGFLKSDHDESGLLVMTTRMHEVIKCWRAFHGFAEQGFVHVTSNPTNTLSKYPNLTGHLTKSQLALVGHFVPNEMHLRVDGVTGTEMTIGNETQYFRLGTSADDYLRIGHISDRVTSAHVQAFLQTIHTFWKKWESQKSQRGITSPIYGPRELVLGDIHLPLLACLEYSDDPKEFGKNLEKFILDARRKFQQTYGIAPTFGGHIPYPFQVQPFLSMKLDQKSSEALAAIVVTGISRNERPSINFTTHRAHNYKMLARRLHDKKQYNVALYYCDKGLAISGAALKADPNNIERIIDEQGLLRTKADILQKLGKLKEAEAIYHIAIHLRPSSDQGCSAMVNLAVSLRKQKRVSEAVHFHEQSISNKKEELNYYIYYSHTYCQWAENENDSSLLKKATDLALRALRIDPGFKWAKQLLDEISELSSKLN